MSTPEIASRHRRAQLVLCLLYVVVPVIQLVVLLFLRAWLGVALALFVLVLFWFLWRGNRYDMRFWPAVGGTTCGMTGFLTGFFAMDHPVYGVLAAVPCAVAGYGLGRLAEHLILNPLQVELADTPYRLVFRLRGKPRIKLAVENEVLRLLVNVTTVQGSKTTHSEQETQLPLASLINASVRQLPDGAALVVQSSAGEWILRHDGAVVLGAIIARRISVPRGTQ